MTDPALKIIRTVDDMHACARAWKSGGERIGFVPTMGALHQGHMALVTTAQQMCDRIVVSIFVNPTQFGPNEDFSSYPRQEAEDIAKLDSAQVDAVFIPSTNEMYPAGFQTTVSVTGITDILCGAARPGHFDGVATIVTKLFQVCAPDVAVFGEKDYQQLMVIRRFVADLNLPVEIAGCPTARESDGLAISSRNAYLSVADRPRAAMLQKVLRDAAHNIRNGMTIEDAEDAGAETLLQSGFLSVDYFDVRDSETLERITRLERPARILAAVHLSKTRLIDNVAIEP